MSKRESTTEIELSTVYFYKGDTPAELLLWDLTLPMVVDTPKSFWGLHGHNAKRDGFMAARDHAAKNGLSFTVVDVLVQIDAMPISQRLKLEDLPAHDFVSLLNVSKEVNQAAAKLLQSQLRKRGEDESQADEGAVPLLSRRPDLAEALLGSAEWKHVRLMVAAAEVTFSAKPLNVGVVPQRHWNRILEANCRLDPTTFVKLK